MGLEDKEAMDWSRLALAVNRGWRSYRRDGGRRGGAAAGGGRHDAFKRLEPSAKHTQLQIQSQASNLGQRRAAACCLRPQAAAFNWRSRLCLAWTPPWTKMRGRQGLAIRKEYSSCPHHHGRSPLIFDLSDLRWKWVGSGRKATKPSGGRFRNKTSRWAEAFSIQSNFR
uniref:Uncharacterized protein n=1 Tax=Setaria viridis TaxID=4556 RepID=A0A4U6T5J3_SETVI|nr:hypothetical protein SEVIR_9G468700v2 [Setaria viridis]